MKYAIMSDVHANPGALETALADARKRGCGRFLMLGDITGYGYDPKRTLIEEMIKRRIALPVWIQELLVRSRG